MIKRQPFHVVWRERNVGHKLCSSWEKNLQQWHVQNERYCGHFVPLEEQNYTLSFQQGLPSQEKTQKNIIIHDKKPPESATRQMLTKNTKTAQSQNHSTRQILQIYNQQ